jgi:hypothetical protein
MTAIVVDTYHDHECDFYRTFATKKNCLKVLEGLFLSTGHLHEVLFLSTGECEVPRFCHYAAWHAYPTGPQVTGRTVLKYWPPV